MDPILIIDDEKDNLEALKRLLRTEYEVTAVESPLEALKIIQSQDYNVIISDQRMAELTGVEFLEKAKTIRPHATRILLTGYTDIEAVIDAINRGNIYRYVAKPWDPEDLKMTLRQANETCKLRRELEVKNEALIKSNEELQKALKELGVLDQSKARFLALVSHELNTPLTVLSSFVSLLSEKRETLPQEVEKAISSISKAAGRFSEIIQEVLTFVRLQSETKYSEDIVDLEEETVRASDNLEADRARKQIAIKLSTVAKPRVKADAEKLRSAIYFFLKDAINRSPQGQEIAVDIFRQSGATVYRVSRGGEQLSENALDPFEPGVDLEHHQKNLGLGLAICRLVVERCGGQMKAEASSEVQKVVISFWTPVGT